MEVELVEDKGVEESKTVSFEETPSDSIVQSKKRSRTGDFMNHDVYSMMELKEEEHPQPFTCICFSEPEDKESSFYVTDQNGFFLHKKKYYRCITDDNQEIKFKFIRELDIAEVCALQSLDHEDVNCITNLSSNNKSLLY